MPLDNKAIFCDMDGVLADFMINLLKVHYRDDLLKLYQERLFPTTWNINGELGSDEDLWLPVDVAGESFWESIPPFDYMTRIIDILENSGIKWYIATTARHTAASCSGKMKWIKRHFGSDFKDVIMIKDKYLLANRNNLLIDDSPDNIRKFDIHGGDTCLFPQPWNEAEPLHKKRITLIQSAIGKLIRKESYEESSVYIRSEV